MNVKIGKKLYIFGILIIFSLVFYFREWTVTNELKYISIVKEAIKNGHYITFYNHGEIYGDKPPLYLWIIMIVKKLTGSYNHILLGLFSIIPAIVTALTMVRLTRDKLDGKEALLAMGLLGTTGIFLGATLILRMDMLMTMFIVLGLESFYKVYSGRGRRYTILLMYMYIFLGVFTKGPVGFLFPLVTISLFLISEKNLKKARELKLGLGLLLLILLFGIWFLGVYLEGGREYLYNLTIKQTIGRSYKAFTHVRPFYYYLTKIETTFLPWSILYIGVFIYSLFKRKGGSEIERFLRCGVAGNFILMSMVSSKLDIYLLPIYPLLAFYTVLNLKRLGLKKLWQVSLIPGVLVFLLLIPGVAILNTMGVIPISIDYKVYLKLSIITFIGLIGGRFLLIREVERATWSIVIGLLLLILSVTTYLPLINKTIGGEVLGEAGVEGKKLYNTSGYIAYKSENLRSIDVYLDDEIEFVDNIDDLERRINEGRVIVYVRGKDIRRTKNKRLREIMSKEKLIYKSDRVYVYAGVNKVEDNIEKEIGGKEVVK